MSKVGMNELPTIKKVEEDIESYKLFKNFYKKNKKNIFIRINYQLNKLLRAKK